MSTSKLIKIRLSLKGRPIKSYAFNQPVISVGRNPDADIVLNTSLNEGMSPVILEAGMLGRPVVASDTPGNRELVRHKETGLLFEDEESMSKCVLALVRKRSAAGAMGVRMREEIKRRFDPEMEIDRLAFIAKTARDMLRASGVGKIIEEYGSYDAFNTTHVFGTCRMGLDPEQSVVDPYGRSHRWQNLFVADASVFPSSGGGEAPSLTIEALGIRTARHLGGLLRSGDL